MCVCDYLYVCRCTAGEVWDAQAKQWEDDSGTADEVFAQMAVQWREGGANVIGGCAWCVLCDAMMHLLFTGLTIAVCCVCVCVCVRGVLQNYS